MYFKFSRDSVKDKHLPVFIETSIFHWLNGFGKIEMRSGFSITDDPGQMEQSIFYLYSYFHDVALYPFYVLSVTFSYLYTFVVLFFHQVIGECWNWGGRQTTVKPSRLSPIRSTLLVWVDASSLPLWWQARSVRNRLKSQIYRHKTMHPEAKLIMNILYLYEKASVYLIWNTVSSCECSYWSF